MGQQAQVVGDFDGVFPLPSLSHLHQLLQSVLCHGVVAAGGKLLSLAA
ncbi:MAG TPA: hypothetical protein VMT28_10080 [Terriglobales bacterium]|nr:hypothetical protein [Terriglobales bacterium]